MSLKLLLNRIKDSMVNSVEISVKYMNQLFSKRDNNNAKSEMDYSRIISQFDLHKELGAGDENCKSIYEKAKREIKDSKKLEMINKITSELRESEIMIREVVMQSFGNKESHLLNFLDEYQGRFQQNDIGQKWREDWENKRNNSPTDLGLISYSSFGELKNIFINRASCKTRRDLGPPVRGISRARRIVPGWTCHRGFSARRIRRASASAFGLLLDLRALLSPGGLQ